MIVVELLLWLRIKWPVDFFGDCFLNQINRHHHNHNHNHNHHSRTHSTPPQTYPALFSKPPGSTPPPARSTDPLQTPTNSPSSPEITKPSIPKTTKEQTRNNRAPSSLNYPLKSAN